MVYLLGPTRFEARNSFTWEDNTDKKIQPKCATNSRSVAKPLTPNGVTVKTSIMLSSRKTREWNN